MYDKIKGVTKGNVNEGIVNGLNYCVKERKRWYDYKHRRNASFYLVDDSRILASPTTDTSNSLYRPELGRKDSSGQTCDKVVDWLLVTNIIIAMS